MKPDLLDLLKKKFHWQFPHRLLFFSSSVSSFETRPTETVQEYTNNLPDNLVVNVVNVW